MANTAAFRKAMEAIDRLADPAPPWNQILTTARELVGADAGTLLLFDKGQDLLMQHQVGIDPAVEQEYQQHFVAQDTIAKAAIARPAGIWWDSTQILPRREMEKNAFHADFLKRSRIGQIQAYIVHNDAFQLAALSFHRITPQAGAALAPGDGEVAAYMRAFTQGLVQRRHASLLQLEAIESTFASLGEATLLVTRTGLIWRLSPLAEQLLRAAKMLSGRTASLTHADPAVAQRLHHALLQAANSCSCVTVTIPFAWGEAYRLDIGPAHPSVKLGTENILFIRMRKNSAFVLPDIEALCATFSITPAEGRVLLALLSGHAPNELATVSGVAERTVRNQIAPLMRKMGCNRQSELVRLGSLLQ